MNYWVREKQGSPLLGPFLFAHADLVARELSRETLLGFSELLCADLRVKYLYVRGRRPFGGRVAAFKSATFNL